MIHTLMIRLTRFTFVILFSFVAVAVQAQTNAYEEYINKYSDMAVEQMKQYPPVSHWLKGFWSREQVAVRCAVKQTIISA